jgi:hypothetical protein
MVLKLMEEKFSLMKLDLKKKKKEDLIEDNFFFKKHLKFKLKVFFYSSHAFASSFDFTILLAISSAFSFFLVSINSNSLTDKSKVIQVFTTLTHVKFHSAS